MFYDKFVELCKMKGEKPTPLLNKLGISSGNIKRWKNGSSVSFGTVIKIADYFNVSLDYLFGRNEKITNVPTGLSAKALMTLMRLKERSDPLLTAINLLLESVAACVTSDTHIV